MILNYSECLKTYGNAYQIKKALSEKLLFKVMDGLYSDSDNPKELEIFIKKHQEVVFTMMSAFYYLGVSDVIPNKYYVVTNKDATKIKDSNVMQYFDNNNTLDVGLIKLSYNGVSIPIYNKERMLIELVRYKNKIPYDYYKEIISYYREHINDIDVSLVLDYIQLFPKKDLIIKIIQSEVL